MNLKLLQPISAFAITLIFLGSFANPTAAKAGFFDDLLGNFGIGNGASTSQYGNYNQSYNNDGTSGERNGDLEITKEARRIGRDDKYHDKIRVRTGELVEVRIEVKNKSSINTTAVVRDELGGSVVYVKNSLRGVPQNSQGSLTSGGLQINVPAKTTTTIFYQFNVCGASGYVTRAYAYAANIGSATDGLLIEMENQNASLYFDEVSICMNQFQNTGSVNSNSNSVTTSANPFGGWTGVNNTNQTTTTTNNNAFGTWTGVNNSTDTSTTTNNSFGGWTGVNNANSTSQSNTDPFGTWTGTNGASGNVGNPFGDWAGSNTTTAQNSNSSTFGTWTGVNNSGQVSNPFGDWTGTQSTSSDYDASGYTANAAVANETSSRPTTNSVAYESTSASTNFVAPTTGVNPLAPFGFAGLLTAGFLAFRNRKFLFN